MWRVGVRAHHIAAVIPKEWHLVIFVLTILYQGIPGILYTDINKHQLTTRGQSTHQPKGSEVDGPSIQDMLP